jgi:transglutaminase-like putative cysteine protease
MIRSFLLAAALVVVESNVFAGFAPTQDFRAATPEELAMTGIPSAPGAAAVILDWVRFDDDHFSNSAEYVRIKVFTEEGKKYADVEIPYIVNYPYNGRISEISARTTRPDGTTVRFDGKVYDKLLYKTSRATVHAKAFSLADVQPGSILEYRFVRRWAPRLVQDTTWTIQRDVPIRHVKLTLKPYDTTVLAREFSTRFTYSGLPPGKVPVKTKGRLNDIYELELENIPAFQSEAFAPPELELKPRVTFSYTRSLVRLDEFWNVEPLLWSKKIEAFLGKSAAAAVAGRDLAVGSDNPTETLRKIYERVQSLRNYSFEAEKSDQELVKQNIGESSNVDEVLGNGAGYRDELNRLFVAMARGAGLDAAAVRVAPRDTFFFSEKLPDAEQMAGEIAAVTWDAQRHFFDPGTPHAPFGTVSWEKSNVPGFLVSRNAPPQWLKVPQIAPSAAVTKRVADLRVDGETLVGTITVTFTGQDALVHRLRAVGEEETARNKELEDEVKAWFPQGATLTTKSVIGLTSSDDAVVAAYDVILPNVISRAGSRMALPPSVFAVAAKNPFAPATRTHPIYFQYPRSEEDEVKVGLPATSMVSVLPTPANLKAGALAYTNTTTQDGNVVTFRRSMMIDAMLVEARYYSAVRNFYNAMVAADQKPLLLVPKAQ